MEIYIISAYFKIKSKKRHEWYLPHLIRFVKNVTGNIMFFTTQDVVDELNLYASTSHITFVILDINELGTFKNKNFWAKHYSLDPERYHSPELGSIWYEKKEFVLRVINNNSDTSNNIYIWCDAGCVRDDLSSTALGSFGKRRVCLPDDKIHLQKVCDYTKQAFYTFGGGSIGIACAIMAGTPRAWVEYKSLYDKTLLSYDTENICGISDQYITMSCIDKNPTLFKLYNDKTRVNEWFKFLEIL